MTEKERIEEMAKVLHDRIVDKTWRAEKVAEELYKIAVPEGSVVISREEKQAYESLAKFFIYDKPIKSRVYEFIKKIKDQVRKETAREILQDFDNHGVYSKDYTDLLRKQFGVEVEE